MLDVLMPVRVDEIKLALGDYLGWDPEDGVIELPKSGRGAIDLLGEMTDVPFRLVICVDGGMRDDYEPLQRYLPDAPFEWQILHNEAVRGERYTLGVLADAVRNEYVAVIPPYIWVDDPKWFGKMQVVFTKDQHCFMVAGDAPNTVSSTLHPVKLDRIHHPKHKFFLSKKERFKNVGAFTSVEDFSRKAYQLGGTRWVAPGVRFDLVRNEHADIG